MALHSLFLFIFFPFFIFMNQFLKDINDALMQFRLSSGLREQTSFSFRILKHIAFRSHILQGSRSPHLQFLLQQSLLKFQLIFHTSIHLYCSFLSLQQDLLYFLSGECCCCLLVHIFQVSIFVEGWWGQLRNFFLYRQFGDSFRKCLNLLCGLDGDQTELRFLQFKNFFHSGLKILVFVAADGFVVLETKRIQSQQLANVVVEGLQSQLDLDLSIEQCLGIISRQLQFFKRPSHGEKLKLSCLLLLFHVNKTQHQDLIGEFAMFQSLLVFYLLD